MSHTRLLLEADAREKVLRGGAALANALTEATLTELPEKDAEPQPGLEG